MNFFDIPEADRMALYREIEACGGSSLSGGMVTVARGHFSDVLSVMAQHGFKLTDSCYFPLGSDKPSDNLRHDGRYPGSKGFWCYARFELDQFIPSYLDMPNLPRQHSFQA